MGWIYIMLPSKGNTQIQNGYVLTWVIELTENEIEIPIIEKSDS
jgi:hypothetical protein